MYELQHHRKTDIDADVYTARGRPGSTDLLLSVGYDAVGLLDIVGDGGLRRIDLPEPDFAIYAWIVAPDGTEAYAFSGDGLDYAVAMDLVGEQAQRVGVPDSSMLATELGWFQPTFSLLDYDRKLWERVEDRLALASKEQTAARLDPELRAFLDRYAVHRLGDTPDEVYVRGRESATNPIGIYRWSTGDALLAETDGSAIDWCHVAGALFVVYEQQIVRIFAGRAQAVLKAAPEELFVRVHAVSHQGRDYLAVVHSAEDHDAPPRAFVTTYLLPR